MRTPASGAAEAGAAANAASSAATAQARQARFPAMAPKLCANTCQVRSVPHRMLPLWRAQDSVAGNRLARTLDPESKPDSQAAIRPNSEQSPADGWLAAVNHLLRPSQRAPWPRPRRLKLQTGRQAKKTFSP